MRRGHVHHGQVQEDEQRDTESVRDRETERVRIRVRDAVDANSVSVGQK